jgi:exopolysaccharide production protein ExoQ
MPLAYAERYAPSAIPARRRTFLGLELGTDLFFTSALCLLLTFIVVEIRYEAAASSLSRETLGLAVIEGAGGDMIRQLTYFMTFIVVAGVTFLFTRPKSIIPISTAYNVACLWCLFSAIYALQPGISIRRAIGMYIILLAVGWCIQNLGAAKTIRALYIFLAGVITVSYVGVLLSRIPLFAFAVHPADEIDTSLIGAWRGVIPHKNIAGAVMIHASLFFFHHAINRRKAIDFLFFFLAAVFLIFTKSKTSISWFLIVLMAGLGYRAIMLYGLRPFFNMATAFVAFWLAVFTWAEWDAVVRFFSDPENLSGRVGIWESVMPFIETHPILGSGYGSFWAIGYSSPIYETAVTEFVTQIGHSHSGYIEVLLTTGLVGLTLAIIALMIVPYYRFANPLNSDVKLSAMLFSMWLFGMLQNFTESQFFSPDKQSWVFVVIAITVIHSRHMAAKSGDEAWLAATRWPAPRPLQPARL